MPTTSSYVKYLPAILWESDPPPNQFSLGTMLCAFEKILTGINDTVPIEHGNNAVMTMVTQSVNANPLPQSVMITPGSGSQFLAGNSYTYNGMTPEVITIIAVNANTITAVFHQNHAANQTIVNSSGAHDPIQTVIANLVQLYGAWTVPSDFLDWLAQWIALQLPASWDEYQRRSAITSIVGIYAQRGTKPGLYEFFKLYALAKRQPRLVVDDGSRLLFMLPQRGLITPVTTLVSRLSLVSPQCMSLDGNGYIYVGDLGTTGLVTNVPPSLWRLSITGQYDISCGKGAVPTVTPNAPTQQTFQPGSLTLNAPLAVAADHANNCAYLIDLTVEALLYRLSAPQIGTITLTGTPTSGESVVVAVDAVPYTLNEAAVTLAAQASAWAGALNGMTPFNTAYTATAAGNAIVITPNSGMPGNDLTTLTSSTHLTLTGTGPRFGEATTFSAPPTGLVLPTSMVVASNGHPLVLDRGAGFANPSKTAIVDIAVTGGVYGGPTAHSFAQIVEPLSLALRANGHIIVGDAVNQSSAAAATLYDIDLATSTITNLLAAVKPADNPLVAPTGVVEVDAEHLMVVDAGLRPYRPNLSPTPFTEIIAQQPAIYSVDLSKAPPVIMRLSDQQSLVYPRHMGGASDGTLYVCDSGLPVLAGYNSQQWRSMPQSFSVIVNFQGDPAVAAFSALLGGTPTAGEHCIITIAGVAYTLPETPGTLANQAASWVTQLNGTTSFAALYIAQSVGAMLSIYAVPETTADSAVLTATSSAHLQLIGDLFAAITLGGTPTTGEHCTVTLDGEPYILSETTGDSLAAQAAAWATTLNATGSFAADYTATGVGNVLAISYIVDSPIASSNLPAVLAGSVHMTLALGTTDLAIGTVTLWGAPTTGENGIIWVAGGQYTLAENSGNTVSAQAAAFAADLNANATFNISYSATSSGAVVNIFAKKETATGITLSAVSSAHLQLTPYSEWQNRIQFLQSITDVVNDEIPAQASWYLQSEQSQA